ncbi:MAG: GatB/YqeY domain-containing protein [Candidatus Saccharimonadales bacterium]
MISQQLNADFKSALLAGDKLRVSVVRSLKSAILYAELDKGKRQEGLADSDILMLFAKEAKKRQESADLYIQGGDKARADKELAEKVIIEIYLPTQLSETELVSIVDEVIKSEAATGMQAMGKVISAVKAKAGPAADGSLIAKLVKERLN